MSPSELLDAVEDQRDVFHYHTSPIARRLSGEWSELCDEPGGYGSVWIGGKGSTTQAHYDVADNVLFQATGRKRVRVWNPSQHASFHVFPDCHPRARKAQANVDRDDRKNFVLRRSLEPAVLDVVLEPGDGVIIPAFWFHHCEALEKCVSLNVFSPSKAARAAAECLAIGSVPIELADDFCGTVSRFISPHLPSSCDPQHFLTERFYATRFEPLQNAYSRAAASKAPPRAAGGHARPRAPSAKSSSSSSSSHEDDDSSESCSRRREAALARCREAAGPAAAEGVTEIVVAHLVEMWGMQLAGHDAALFVSKLLQPLAKGPRSITH